MNGGVDQQISTQKKKYFYLCSLIIEGGNDWAELFMMMFELELDSDTFLDIENKFFSCLIQTKAPEYVLQYVFSDREFLDPNNKEVISIAHWVVKRHPVPHMDHDKREMIYYTRYSQLSCMLGEKDKKSRFHVLWTRCADAFDRLQEESTLERQIQEEVAMRKLMLKCKAPEFLYSFLFRGIECNEVDLQNWILDLSSSITPDNPPLEEISSQEELPELELIKQGFILPHETRGTTATEDVDSESADN